MIFNTALILAVSRFPLSFFFALFLSLVCGFFPPATLLLRSFGGTGMLRTFPAGRTVVQMPIIDEWGTTCLRTIDHTSCYLVRRGRFPTLASIFLLLLFASVGEHCPAKEYLGITLDKESVSACCDTLALNSGFCVGCSCQDILITRWGHVLTISDSNDCSYRTVWGFR